MVVENQETLNKDDEDGDWIEVDKPRDPNEIYLEVGDEFVGFYLETRKNQIYTDDVIHVFKVKDEAEEKFMYGKSNLDKWMDAVPVGNIVKIKRFKDVHIPNKPKPLQQFKVWVWIKKKNVDTRRGAK